jgi:hypothetical protein
MGVQQAGPSGVGSGMFWVVGGSSEGRLTGTGTGRVYAEAS